MTMIAKINRRRATNLASDFPPSFISLIVIAGALALTGCTGLISGNSSNGTGTGTPPSLSISASASSGITSTSATVSWQTNLPATSQVQYGTSASYGLSTTLDSTMVTSHQQILSGLQPATLYHFRVLSTDVNNNVANGSDLTFTTATGSTPDTMPPSVPTGLAATAISTSQINLSWNPSTDNVGVTGYKIFRGGSQVATSATTTYQDTALSAATSYTYNVAAFDAAGNTSMQSASATATTTANTFQLSGSISPATSASGATLTLSGAGSGSTTADASGNFAFAGLANGSYTVTPTRVGFTFSPGSQTTTINGGNVTGVNFTATSQTYSISGTISPASIGSGATVSLSGTVSKTATADVSGNYSFTGLTNGSYSIAPSKSGVSFSPTSQPATINSANITGINFTASAQTLSISGSISPAASGSGATVTLTGTSSGTTTADASGNYSFTGLINGNFTVAASKTGFAFSPASQSVSLNGTNATGVNFTATPQTFSVSGTVSPALIGAGITMNLGGAATGTTTTDSSGNYTFTGLASASYTVTPSKTGYTFAPTSQSATVSGANVTGINFTATAPTFTISGTISPATSGSGAVVTLSGPSNTTAAADNSGNFSFGGLLNGTYTVTPSKTGFSFNPSSLPAVVTGANVSGLAFTATPSSQNVIFFDDFTTTPLGPAWTALNRAGDSSGNEQQCNIPGDVSVSNSNMLIVSKVQSMNCQTSTSPSQTYSYTSGAVQWTSFNFTYGTIEYRLQLPSAGQGLRPVIWLLGANCQQTNITTPDNVSPCNWDFPGSEEIDITEMIGSYYFSINQALHASSLDYGCVPNVDVSTGFHTYQLVWKPGSLTWNVDGVATCTVNNSNVPSSPMFLIVETTVGGSGGTINNSTLPQTMSLDYVKVTQP
jgi:hypothetical protein